MEQSGLVDIQSHTHTHCNMSKQGKMALISEVVNSYELIERNLGKRDVRVLCYPEFKYSKMAREIAKNNNVQLQITSLAGKGAEGNYPNDLRRIHAYNTLSTKKLIDKIKSLTS